ncbi:MAG: DICT sensory domain-containing protein [Xenococcaceae cyanobacterium MO_188.B29]|nr:DICT sensory domain-containing protein [Xenococcaceae cyanobacterium MO_188.B29]
MSISKSVVAQLLQSHQSWRPQMYFKSSLTALSHAMEDLVLASSDIPLVIASFQRERFYRQEAHRYRRIASKTSQVYVLAAPETDFKNSSDVYETIAFEPTDALAQEWHLVIISNSYASCLFCQEKTALSSEDRKNSAMDGSRRFEGIWTFDRQVCVDAAEIMLKRILVYRPELKGKINEACQTYLGDFSSTGENRSPQAAEGLSSEVSSEVYTPRSFYGGVTVTSQGTKVPESPVINPDPFVQRLLNYLQVGQYKLLKANKSLALKQEREHLINSITTAIRRSLDTEEILRVVVQQLGEGLEVCRCLVYRCSEDDAIATIKHEFLSPGIDSLKGKTWQLKDNPLFEEVVELREALTIDNTDRDPRITDETSTNEEQKYLQNLVKTCSISSWLLVPVLYQDRILGMMELHHCQENPLVWKEEDVALVNAIATQVGVALIQAEAYANLEELNEQLEALDRTRSNLVAITGHELRTPLSTIQVCLESLASEPDMSPELRQVMLNTALADADRMRKLVQDFLTLSQLESGRIEWHPELLSLSECIDLAVSNVRARRNKQELPQIVNLTTSELPLIEVDGEWLVEVLAKLLDNACKFTSSDGKITINVQLKKGNNLEVIIADTGRGIEPNRLEKVFDRFYQEEGALRRSAGGTGLGLAICRQIVNNWGGEIWAESAGKNQGSVFHFTIPLQLSQSKN